MIAATHTRTRWSGTTAASGGWRYTTPWTGASWPSRRSLYYVPARGNTATRSGRRIVTVWLAFTGVAEIDRIAQAEGVTRSEMIRTLLREAIQARRPRTGTVAGKRPG